MGFGRFNPGAFNSQIAQQGGFAEGGGFTAKARGGVLAGIIGMVGKGIGQYQANQRNQQNLQAMQNIYGQQQQPQQPQQPQLMGAPGETSQGGGVFGQPVNPYQQLQGAGQTLSSPIF